MSWNRRLMMGEALNTSKELDLDYLTIVCEDLNCQVRIEPMYAIKDGEYIYAELWGSVDGGDSWVDFSRGGHVDLDRSVQRVLLKGNGYNFMKNNPTWAQSGQRWFIYSSSGHYSLEGTPLSLLHADTFRTNHDLIDGCFTNLFGTDYTTNYGLLRINNPETFLPSKVMKPACYELMFALCENLENAPKLPATKLADYCYAQMFNGCYNLGSAPELPSKTLEIGCYFGMFASCTKLKDAPILSASTLVEGCYCYMFYYCKELSYIEAMFTTTPSVPYTTEWVEEVSTTGTFVKNKNATWDVRGKDGIPSGWNVETK